MNNKCPEDLFNFITLVEYFILKKNTKDRHRWSKITKTDTPRESNLSKLNKL
jgi:hypothetical protein